MNSIMSATQNESNISLTYNDVAHNKVKSLQTIEGQISHAINLIPSSFAEVRCILDCAVNNVRTLKEACNNEGNLSYYS